MPSNKMDKSDKPEVMDNVKVVVRCRPLNQKERSMGHKQAVSVDENRGTITVNKLETTHEPPKTFTFDTVFGPDSKQLDVYNLTARPIIDSVLEGYNGTIFAYGQTGTGKTFTMEGVRAVPELRGIIPNSFAHVFGHIAKAEGDTRFLVRVSYLEIYNEEVRDLLGKDQMQRLEVKERPDVGVYIKDLSGYVVNNADDMDRIMTMGHKNRSVGSTNMNEHSSRSHAIFTITIECSEKGVDGDQHVRMGKLHLVDLAGSERQGKTGATGQRLKEATKINLSLSTLGNVISALVDGKSTHVPYRNSKLTRLLQDSLGGNSKTMMVTNNTSCFYFLLWPSRMELSRSSHINTWHWLISSSTHGIGSFLRQHMALAHFFVNTWHWLISSSTHGIGSFLRQHMALAHFFVNTWHWLISSSTHGIGSVVVERLLLCCQMADLQQEHHREIEGLLENIRHLSRELRLQMLIIDSFIPQEYQEMIENYVQWNEDIGEWQLKCVAYTGNNMRKQTPVPDKKEKDPFELDLSHVYLAYTEESMRQSLMKLERPRSSKSSRPKTGRRKRSAKPEAVMESLLQ
eukprot:XP_014068661.1 PREDICTED: kinesin-like protein KIF3A [Salmo salar]